MGRKRRERGKRRSGLRAGLVPITPEAWGRFVCTGKGVPEEGRGRLMLLLPTGTPLREHQLLCLSLLLLCPSPVPAFPHCFSPLWSKVQTSPPNCLRMFSVYFSVLGVVPKVPVTAFGHCVHNSNI